MGVPLSFLTPPSPILWVNTVDLPHNSLDFSLGNLITCAWGHTHNFFFLQCTRGSSCSWPRVRTFLGGTQCIDHCCGSFGHGSVHNMCPALFVAFLVCSMSPAVIRTPDVAFRRMSGSVASEWGWCVQTPGNADLVRRVDCIWWFSPAMALHGTTKAHSVRNLKQMLATHRPGGEGSRTAGSSCRRPHHRSSRGHHRGGRTRPTHPPRARRCATARDQHSRRTVGRRADEATSPTHPPARPRADAAAALTAAPPVVMPPHSSPPPLNYGGRAPPTLRAGKGAGSATSASPAAAAAAVAPAIAATVTGGGCDGGDGGGGLWSMAPPSPLPPLAGVRTAADAPAGGGGAEFDGGLPAAAAAAPNGRGRGDRDGCGGRPAAVCTSGGVRVFVCLWLGGGGAAVTAAAWAAAAAVLVGGGLFAEDARPREAGGSRGQVVGGCFARYQQVQGISLDFSLGCFFTPTRRKKSPYF